MAAWKTFAFPWELGIGSWELTGLKREHSK
jgi:hypothetical protein